MFQVGLELLLAVLIDGPPHVEDPVVLDDVVLSLFLKHSFYFKKTHIYLLAAIYDLFKMIFIID